MTLCGVLKDIILVFASIAIWGTQVSALQFFGYSLALGGMIYYKLGAESLKGFFAEGNRWWAEYGAKRPAQRKMVVFGAIILTLFLILGGLAPTVGYDTKSLAKTKEYAESLLGKGTGTVVTKDGR